MESSDQSSFRGRSRDQDEFWATKINRSTHFLRYLAGVATYVLSFELPWNQVIKSFGTERSSDQGQFSTIKILDPGRKRFYRRRVCDYPLTLYRLYSRIVNARYWIVIKNTIRQQFINQQHANHLGCIKARPEHLAIALRETERLRKCIISTRKLPLWFRCEAAFCALVFVIHAWSWDDVNGCLLPTVVG